MAKLDEQTAEERDQPKPVKKEKTKKEVIPKLPKSKPLTEESQEVSEEAEVKVAPVVKSKKPRIRKERKDEILTKVCPVEVCLPEICCADMEGELASPTTARTTSRPFVHPASREPSIYRCDTVIGASYGQTGAPASCSKITRSARHDPITAGHFFALRGFIRVTITALCNSYETGCRERRRGDELWG